MKESGEQGSDQFLSFLPVSFFLEVSSSRSCDKLITYKVAVDW